MDTETIKARIRQFNQDVWDKGNIAVADDFLAPNYAGHDVSNKQLLFTREIMKQNFAQSYANNAAVQVVVDDIVVEGNKAAFRWTASATDKTGETKKFVGFSMYTFEDGKVTEDYFLNHLVQEEVPAT